MGQSKKIIELKQIFIINFLTFRKARILVIASSKFELYRLNKLYSKLISTIYLKIIVSKVFN